MKRECYNYPPNCEPPGPLQNFSCEAPEDELAPIIFLDQKLVRIGPGWLDPNTGLPNFRDIDPGSGIPEFKFKRYITIIDQSHPESRLRRLLRRPLFRGTLFGQTYGNDAVIGVSRCPDGTIFEVTLLPNVVYAKTKRLANRLAKSIADRTALLKRICISDPKPSFCCFNSDISFMISINSEGGIADINIVNLPPGFTYERIGDAGAKLNYIKIIGEPQDAPGEVNVTINAASLWAGYNTKQVTLRLIGLSDPYELPDAFEEQTYNYAFNFVGPTPDKWTIGGQLPNGLNFDANAGGINGKPMSDTTGNYYFTIKCAVGNQVCSQDFALAVKRRIACPSNFASTYTPGLTNPYFTPGICYATRASTSSPHVAVATLGNISVGPGLPPPIDNPGGICVIDTDTRRVIAAPTYDSSWGMAMSIIYVPQSNAFCVLSLKALQDQRNIWFLTFRILAINAATLNPIGQLSWPPDDQPLSCVWALAVDPAHGVFVGLTDAQIGVFSASTLQCLGSINIGGEDLSFYPYIACDTARGYALVAGKMYIDNYRVGIFCRYNITNGTGAGSIYLGDYGAILSICYCPIDDCYYLTYMNTSGGCLLTIIRASNLSVVKQEGLPELACAYYNPHDERIYVKGGITLKIYDPKKQVWDCAVNTGGTTTIACIDDANNQLVCIESGNSVKFIY